MVKNDIGLNLKLDCLEKNLRKAIESRAKTLNVADEKIEKMLNKEYSFLVSGIWNTKTRNVKKGLGLQGRNQKMEYIKLTTKEHLFETINELVILYKAYKSIDNIRKALLIIEYKDCN